MTSNRNQRVQKYPIPRGGAKWERKGGRNIDVREKHQLVASHMHPNRGSNPQPRYMPWPGIKPAAFWGCMGTTLQPTEPHGQDFPDILMTVLKMREKGGTCLWHTHKEGGGGGEEKGKKNEKASCGRTFLAYYWKALENLEPKASIITDGRLMA